MHSKLLSSLQSHYYVAAAFRLACLTPISMTVSRRYTPVRNAPARGRTRNIVHIWYTSETFACVLAAIIGITTIDHTSTPLLKARSHANLVPGWAITFYRYVDVVTLWSDIITPLSHVRSGKDNDRQAFPLVRSVRLILGNNGLLRRQLPTNTCSNHTLGLQQRIVCFPQRWMCPLRTPWVSFLLALRHTTTGDIWSLFPNHWKLVYTHEYSTIQSLTWSVQRLPGQTSGDQRRHKSQHLAPAFKQWE